MKLQFSLLTSAIALGVATGAFAKVPDEVIARVGQDLTPMGSEIAGNADGSIPAWDGGITAPPAGVTFDGTTQLPPDPFASDAPLFRITKANMAQYADKLSVGHQALLSQRDTYFMDVYKSRRSCALPSFVYDANKRNMAVGELTKTPAGGLDGNGVLGAIMGHPFPIGNSANEMLWNHTLRYRSFKVTRQFAAFPVQSGGATAPITVQDEAILSWSDPAATKAEDLNNISIYYIANTVAPARLAGNVILVHESLNAAVDPRKAWSYNPGTRRVRRAPDIAYDNPGTNTDGMSTSDSFDGYNGAPDRYDWTIIGKNEMYIPYNNYKAMNAKYDDLVKPVHLNQDLVRYELHRVWQYEAKLRPGTRHIYARRSYQMDEDYLGIVGSELYDGRGELWRIQEQLTVNRYHVPTCFIAGEVVYDIQDRRYLALSLQNEEKVINFAADELKEDRYTPQAIRNLGVR
ncbi:MAG: DUF1329 domain-containing protein [Alphaproteobacteria bacterium]|nr:DUF1329 domain-containing protein [Alphaproteobacteria bacterium]